MLHSPLRQCSCRFCTCRHIYMPWNSKEIVERKCSVGLHSIRLLGSTHSMLTVNTPLTLLLASLTLASEGLYCSTIRCLQVLGEKDMVPVLYSIPWSESLFALCGESVHLESEVGRQDLSWICETLLLFLYWFPLLVFPDCRVYIQRLQLWQERQHWFGFLLQGVPRDQVHLRRLSMPMPCPHHRTGLSYHSQ